MVVIRGSLDMGAMVDEIDAADEILRARGAVEASPGLFVNDKESL